MAINTKTIRELRLKTGAAILDCKKALEESGGDIEKAIAWLRKQGQKIVARKKEKKTGEGLIESYVHKGRVGALVELHSETDFVARSKEFKELAHDLAMQVVAMSPLYLKEEDVPEELKEKEREILREQLRDEKKPQEIIEKIIKGRMKKFFEEICLLDQLFIKDEEITIKELINQKVAQLKENIQVKRFTRYEI